MHGAKIRPRASASPPGWRRGCRIRSDRRWPRPGSSRYGRSKKRVRKIRRRARAGRPSSQSRSSSMSSTMGPPCACNSTQSSPLKAVRRAEIETQTVIDDLAVGIEKSAKLDFSRLRCGSTADRFADGQRPGPERRICRCRRCRAASRSRRWCHARTWAGLRRRRLFLLAGFDALGDDPLLRDRQHVVDHPV